MAIHLKKMTNSHISHNSLGTALIKQLPFAALDYSNIHCNKLHGSGRL